MPIITLVSLYAGRKLPQLPTEPTSCVTSSNKLNSTIDTTLSSSDTSCHLWAPKWHHRLSSMTTITTSWHIVPCESWESDPIKCNQRSSTMNFMGVTMQQWSNLSKWTQLYYHKVPTITDCHKLFLYFWSYILLVLQVCSICNSQTKSSLNSFPKLLKNIYQD